MYKISKNLEMQHKLNHLQDKDTDIQFSKNCEHEFKEKINEADKKYSK